MLVFTCRLSGINTDMPQQWRAALLFWFAFDVYCLSSLILLHSASGHITTLTMSSTQPFFSTSPWVLHLLPSEPSFPAYSDCASIFLFPAMMSARMLIFHYVWWSTFEKLSSIRVIDLNFSLSLFWPVLVETVIINSCTSTMSPMQKTWGLVVFNLFVMSLLLCFILHQIGAYLLSPSLSTWLV